MSNRLIKSFWGDYIFSTCNLCHFYQKTDYRVHIENLKFSDPNKTRETKIEIRQKFDIVREVKDTKDINVRPDINQDYKLFQSSDL